MVGNVLHILLFIYPNNTKRDFLLYENYTNRDFLSSYFYTNRDFLPSVSTFHGATYHSIQWFVCHKITSKGNNLKKVVYLHLNNKQYVG